MLAMLLQGDYLIFVHGKPDVFLTNQDYSKVLRNPNLAKKIRDALQIQGDIIIGNLGILEDGVYKDDIKAVRTTTHDRKELHFYESL